jgi:hypothetical protein
MSGICAEKALEQHLCERFHNLHCVHIFILVELIARQRQILLSRGFNAYVPDIFFIKMHMSN